MWQLMFGLFWTSCGFFLSRRLPTQTPNYLGKMLYWIGVPLQVLFLTHQSTFTSTAWLPPLATIVVLGLGCGVALLSMEWMKQLKISWMNDAQDIQNLSSQQQLILLVTPKVILRRLYLSIVFFFSQLWPKQPSSKGSFVLASVLGNTGFIGLAIAPSFVHPAYLGWIVVYGMIHNVIGSYGLGVLVANHFGNPFRSKTIVRQIFLVLSIPTLWTFVIGYISQSMEFPSPFLIFLQGTSTLVVPSAFLLIGMQLSKIRTVESIQMAFFPSLIKIFVLPGLAGLGLTLMGIVGDARLALVLMTGMPTAFANLILAEEYDLDRQMAAGSILISTIGLPLLIPIWLTLFS
jgi:malate permease and related proteins